MAVTKENVRFAGLGIRFLALFIDLMLFCAIFFPVTRLVKGTWLMSPTDHQWNNGLFILDPLCIFFLVIMFLYFTFLEGLAGFTLGKRIAGLRVVRADWKVPPGLLKGLLRNLLRIVDGLPALNILGIVLILVSDERKRLGDIAADTRVVRKRKNIPHD